MALAQVPAHLPNPVVQHLAKAVPHPNKEREIPINAFMERVYINTQPNGARKSYIQKRRRICY